MKPLMLEAYLPDRLDRLAAQIGRRLASVYRDEFGLNMPEWRTLATLGEFETCTATQIATHSNLHKTEVSRALASLRRRRWIAKKPNKQDRREDIVSLTASGRRSHGRLIARMNAVERWLKSLLEPSQVRALEKVLTALELALVDV